jgi:hypothetical protein
LNRLNAFKPPARPYFAASERVERLPFRVRVVTTPQDLAKAVEIRASAYARHLPALGPALQVPEAEDLQPDVLVLLAERKFDGAPIGSLRLQSNVRRPLRLQGEAPPLEGLSSKRLVESTRLGVGAGPASKVVTATLIKAAYEVCRSVDVDYNVIGGRRSMAQFFRAMQFDELAGGPFPISFGNNIPHWIFVLPVAEFELRLQQARHWYYEYFARTEHPDIEIDWAYVFSAFNYS